jgi:LAS superfamily LD-carboxypeptidase LdcB
MDAFKQAEQKAGQRILLTGSYRTCAAEFALSQAKPTLGTGNDPGASYHVRGLAIDVNTTILSSNITAALLATGWSQFDAAKEPWHFSFGGTG